MVSTFAKVIPGRTRRQFASVTPGRRLSAQSVKASPSATSVSPTPSRYIRLDTARPSASRPRPRHQERPAQEGSRTWNRRQPLPTGAAGSARPAASSAAQVVRPARTAMQWRR
jgi:hypothetical protein